MAPTEYVVLRHDGDKWDKILVVTAPSRDAAKLRAAEARAETSHADGGDGTYVAVPSASWDPTEIEIEVPKPKAIVRSRTSG